MQPINPSTLSDTDLISTTRLAASHERDATAKVVALLAEVNTRRLYLGEGYSSMFAFCTRALHMSEHEAYARIEAARLSARFPGLLERLATGRLSLTTIGLLAPHLSDENAEPMFEAAEYKSKRDVERLIANFHPQPDIPATIRALPMTPPTPACSDVLSTSVDVPSTNVPTLTTDLGRASAEHPGLASKVSARAVVAPLAPRRYLLRVTIGEETQQKLERARDLLRHEIPGGDPAVIIDKALALLLADVERTKFAATRRKSTGQMGATPASQSRRIPAAVRREVWARDQGKCAFIGSDGPCGETGFLEFHHVVPFSAGGASTVENLELRCRAHNGYEAERAGLPLWRPAATRSGPS